MGLQDQQDQTVVDEWVGFWEKHGTFQADGLTGQALGEQPPYSVVSMFPYPSGDLHMGHAEVYTISDAMARFRRMRGWNVLNPIAWDSFGLPAENAARKRGLSPRDWTYSNIEVQAESFRRLGIAFDWRTRFHTSDPEYYRWNQWIFLRLFERGLAYRKAALVNWCPVDETVLANEQVVQGRCERCGSQVVQRDLVQWFFRITQYAQRLLDDMAELEGAWPDEILAMQRNWIGRSEGAYIEFPVVGRDESVRVFSTRPDTVFGATFLVVAVDSPLAAELCAPDQKDEFEQYRGRAAPASDFERLSSDRPVTGVALGRHATHPLTGGAIPIYASDYVLAAYGSGAVMGVPAHDQRDLNFAGVMGLPVPVVVMTGEANPIDSGVATEGFGPLVNSGPFDGLAGGAAITAVATELQRLGSGSPGVTYRIRDWLLSRQRYWGTPIPIIHCSGCGEVAVPDDQLPVRLPETGYTLQPDNGESPLETAQNWLHVSCPRCGGEARRDGDTMDTFVDSSWYFLRYPNPEYADGPFDPEGVQRWMPVDDYIGGKEHATGHLMYARFLTKALHDLGLIDFVEPFRRLTNQGQVIMDGKAMSKSLGNLVNLQDQIAQYGPDAVRVSMIFAGPPEDDIDWADVSPVGSVKWLGRVRRLATDVGQASTPKMPTSEDVALRRGVHKLIAQTTKAMESHRFNVGVARLMELTSLLRKSADSADGAGRLAVREGADALVRMLSCYAPFTAEEAWRDLGNEPSVIEAGWPEADPEMLVESEAVCVVQVAGRKRDVLKVPADIGEEALRALALASPKVAKALGDANVRTVIVRAPGLVNVVPA